MTGSQNSETAQSNFPTIREQLVQGTFLADAEIHSSIGSTNDRGLELAESPFSLCPLLVWGVSQTAGRGRKGDRWLSLPGALTFSLVLDLATLQIPKDRRALLPLVAGMAVCDVIRRRLPGASSGVKWPNDVWLSGKKVCGMLAETSLPFPDRVVLGIGLNVLNSIQQAPAEIRNTATAIVDEFDLASAESADCGSLVDWLRDLLVSLEAGLRRLRNVTTNWSEVWRDYCVLDGQLVVVSAEDRPIVGRVAGIQADGGLKLKTHIGEEVVYAGSVRLWSS